MKKIIVLAALSFWCLESSIGQTEQSPKVNTVNVYGDFGIGFWSSTTINMEVLLVYSESDYVHLYARGGYGWISQYEALCEGDTSKGGIMGLTMLTKKGNHHFEITGGAYLGSWNEKFHESSFFCNGGIRVSGLHRLITADVGYRYQNPKSHFIFRVKIGVLGLGIGLGFGI